MTEKKSQVECEVMLASFESNKAPRNNDISANFYRKFWHLLCLLELYVTSRALATLKNGELSTLYASGENQNLFPAGNPFE